MRSVRVSAMRCRCSHFGSTAATGGFWGSAARSQQWQTMPASSARRASRTSPTRAYILAALASSTITASRNTGRSGTAQRSRRCSARSVSWAPTTCCRGKGGSLAAPRWAASHQTMRQLLSP
eukprot:4111326-Pyramimonas_sp.AAC.1